MLRFIYSDDGLLSRQKREGRKEGHELQKYFPVVYGAAEHPIHSFDIFW